MRLNEFLDHKTKLNEAGPAVLALPVGAAAMEAMAWSLGFAGAAALAYDISQNPDRYNRAMRSAASAYIAVSDWLRDNPTPAPRTRDDSDEEEIPGDLARDLETQTQRAVETQPEEIQQRVSTATQEVIDQVDRDADAAADMVAQWAAQARAAADAGADAAQAARTAPQVSTDAPAAMTAPTTDDEAPSVARTAGEPAVATGTPAAISTPRADEPPTVARTAGEPAVATGTASMTAPAADDAPGVSGTVDVPVSRRTAPALAEPPATGNDLPNIDTDVPGIGKDVDLGLPASAQSRGRDRDAAAGAQAGTAGAGAVSGDRDDPIAPPIAGAPPITGIGDLPVTGADAGVIAAPAARAISRAADRAATAASPAPRRPGGTGLRPRRGLRLPNLDARFDLGKFSPIQIADPLDLQRSKRFQ